MLSAANATEDTNNATTDQDNSFSQPVFAAFSKTFASKLIDRDARLFAVYRYYQTCPSGRFLSHILVATKDQADAALASIRAGQKFDVVARALSIDTTSGTRGGALGCLAPGYAFQSYDYDWLYGYPLIEQRQRFRRRFSVSRHPQFRPGVTEPGPLAHAARPAFNRH